MMKNITISIAKVDVEEMIKDFKVTNADSFTSYLKEDLAQRSDDKLKGINKLTFTSYYELPGIIADRLFAVFDTSLNGYIDLLEFLEGMRTLFTQSFDKQSQFIFNLYDFDKDGLISKEDIRTVLSYVTLSKEKISSGDCQDYIDRVHSQEELHQILENCFALYSNEQMNYSQFLNIIENTNSDIYFFILLFLLEKKPFTNLGLFEYEKQKASPSANILIPKANSYQVNAKINKTPSKLVATPNSNSAFSPCLLFSKSPIIEKSSFGLMNSQSNNKEYFNQIVGRGKEKHSTAKEPQAPNLNTFLKAKEKERQKAKAEMEINKSPRNPVYRKPKTNLKELENSKCNVKQQSVNIYNELPITPAFKQMSTPKQGEEGKPLGNNFSETTSVTSNTIQQIATEISKNNTIEDGNTLSNDMEILTFGDVPSTDNDNINNEFILNQSDSDNEERNEVVKHEGYLYKITETKKLKKLWFKLLHKDLYYFKNEKEKIHKGMHNLSGVFLKEEKPMVIGTATFFTFSVIYPKKVRYYYVDNQTDYQIWVEKMKVATGYANLNEIYEVKEKLGNGKFGLVRLGIHKQTEKQVAIKIMSKKDMNTQDLELVKTEIEILKVSQHPNIIRLYEVFENEDYFYIIMEHCGGGDLFSYIEKRGFRLPEQRACQIIHKICVAVCYIHSYGIAHRDLKPENVLMTDTTDEADIRLLDFGLSKIVGPGQNCTEPYGTLSYVAPEVLLEQPYTKAVDLWSIGVTTYLLIAGCLPFDHETSEREIARQTIHDQVPYKGSIWKRTSTEAKSFIDSLLQKDPSKRLDIKQALEHEWIQKYCGKVTDIRKQSRDAKASTFQIYTSTEGLF